MCFIQVLWRPQRNGGVAEWFKATVLKTVDCNRSMSSNPIASAIFCTDKALIIQGFVVSGIQEMAPLSMDRFRIFSAIPATLPFRHHGFDLERPGDVGVFNGQLSANSGRSGMVGNDR